MVIDTVQNVPLTQWKDGTIRVKGTRLLIDMIVNAHKRGESPEEIFDAFPSQYYSVADIYAVIAYYLTHKAPIDRYLAKREREAEKIWKKIESDPKHQAHRAELRRRMTEFHKTRR